MPDKSLFPQKPVKRGERYEYLSLIFWPENGFIYIEDSDDDSFTTCSRREWLARANSFNEDAKRLADISTRAGNEWKKMSAVQERDAMISLVECMVDCAKRAKDQGDPTDPKVIDHIRKHEMKRRRSFSVPGNTTGGNIIIP
tara:strand:- start:335 stop:760 length:426 start_codon:yes stop_codon:yes gene_type:complete